MSPCVSANGTLSVSEITTHYWYQLTSTGAASLTTLNATFLLKVAILKSLAKLETADLNAERLVVSGSEATVSVPATSGGAERFSVTFSDVDITMGCNSLYGSSGYFALLVELMECVEDGTSGTDTLCGQLFTQPNSLYPEVCTAAPASDGRVFIYHGFTNVTSLGTARINILCLGSEPIKSGHMLRSAPATSHTSNSFSSSGQAPSPLYSSSRSLIVATERLERLKYTNDKYVLNGSNTKLKSHMLLETIIVVTR